MAKGSVRRKALEYFIEFVLVVVGISIAFWLSERSEENKKDRLEKQYLSDLLEDLEADVDLLEYLDALNQQKLEFLSRGAAFYTDPNTNLTVDSIPKYADKIGNLHIFDPNDFTYSTLQQSGDFKIIKSHDVRKQLIKLYSSYETIDVEQTNLVQALDDNYYPTYFENYEMMTDRIANPQFFRSTFMSNFLAFTINQTNTIMVYFERSRNIAGQTCELIRKELEK